MTQPHDSFQEKLNDLSLQKRVESWLPAFDKMQSAIPSLARTIEFLRGQLTLDSLYSDGFSHIEKIQVPELNTEVTVRFYKTGKGSADVDRIGMPIAIEILKGGDAHFTKFLINELLRSKEKKDMRRAPIRLLDDCLEYQPIFGGALIVNYFRSDFNARKQFDGCSEEEADASSITLFCIEHANFIVEDIDSFINTLIFNTDDELTRRFLDDLQKDMKSLVFECLFHLTYLLHDYRAGRTPHTLYLSHFRCPVKEDESDYWRGSVEKLIRDHLVPFAKKTGLLSEAEVMALAFQNQKVHDVLYIPFLLSWKDIKSFIGRLVAVWGDIAESIKDPASMNVSQKSGHTFVHCKNGVSFLLRPKKNITGIQKEDARFSMQVPYQDIFNIRVDRDEYVQSVSLEYGRLPLPAALALAACIPHFIQQGKHYSVFDVEVENLMQDDLPSHILSQGTKVGWNEKVAYLVSVVMSDLSSDISRAQSVGQSVSYHRREHIAKDEYYDNFSHMIEEIKNAFIKMKHK